MIIVYQITTDCKLAYLLSKSLFAFRNTKATKKHVDVANDDVKPSQQEVMMR